MNLTFPLTVLLYWYHPLLICRFHFLPVCWVLHGVIWLFVTGLFTIQVQMSWSTCVMSVHAHLDSWHHQQTNSLNTFQMKLSQIATVAGNALSYSTHIPGPFIKSLHPHIKILHGKCSKFPFKHFCFILQLYDNLSYKTVCYIFSQKCKTQGLVLRKYARHKPLLVILSQYSSLHRQ